MYRKQKLLIFLLFLFTLLGSVYVRRELFFQQAKKLIEQNLEKNFPGQFSIGKIVPKPFYGLVLEDLMVSFPNIANIAVDIQVKQAWVDYNLWQTISWSENKDAPRLRLIAPNINLNFLPTPSATAVSSAPANNFHLPSLNTSSAKAPPRDFVFILEGGRISSGQPENLLLKDLGGKIIFQQSGLYFQDLRASLGGNARDAIKFYGQAGKDKISFTTNIEHLKIKNFDILTNLSLTLDKKLDVQDKVPKISGTLKTYGTVLNSRPFPELNSVFEIRDSKLRILTFNLGQNYDLRGIISLNAPFQADLSLNFYQAALNELIWQFTSPGQADFSGLCNGLIKISGQLTQPQVEGYLEAGEGHIGDLDFLSADINIKGRYPKIIIADSRILRENDSFLMEGEIDFSDLGRQDLVDIQVKADKGIFWQGWDITRNRDNQVHLSKSVADDVKITFDTFTQPLRAGAGFTDERAAASPDNAKNELGLEYHVFGDKLLKLRLRKEEEILGVEQRIRF